jgi:hypothetical protein
VRITKPKRSKGGAKRLDLSDMRHVFKDGRIWCSIGVVTAPDGDAHWHVAANDSGTSVDVIVEVVLQPSEDPCSCRLRAGMWEVPNEGDEVLVMLPEGALDFAPIIVCKLSSRSVPTAQGPQPDKLVIVVPNGGEVLVHDGSGGAAPLVTRAEFLSHGHATAATGPVTPPMVAPAPASEVLFPGTTVLKAK